MSTFSLEPAMSVALWIVIKATALLGAAALVQAATHRRTSAAARHQLWTLAIVAVLLLPVLSFALPKWPVVFRVPAAEAAPVAPLAPVVDEVVRVERSSALVAEAAAPPTARPTVAIPWPIMVAVAYAAGVVLMLLRLIVQRRSVQRLAREATDLLDPEWTPLLRQSATTMGVRRPVRLLRSREGNMPMAFGTRRPAILIPATADTWPEGRRRAVVLHELAHVARYDCLTQLLAFTTCTVYWFHPAAWWVARRLRIERELACDDCVISTGARPREYAEHLLDIAYSLGRRRAPALAVAMARPRQLEGRMLAVLDAARNRSVPAVRARVAATFIAVTLLVALASATSSVVAVPPDAARTSATPMPAPEQQAVVGRDLKAVEWPLIESARRVVRGAAEAIGIAQNGLPGTWEIRPTSTSGTVHLRLVELNSSSGSDIPVERLEGLTAAQLSGAGGPVQFRLRRDAGTFSFEGVFRSGVGAGTFSFAPDSKFPDELARRGFERPSAVEQYQLARHDIGYAFLDELSTQRYAKPRTSELVRAGQHGVQVPYLREMGVLGYRLETLEPLIELRDHGVTPTYIRQIADQGYKGLAADELKRTRDHGITPEYVRAMQEAGYGGLPMDKLINARDHGITAEYVRGLGELGYRKLSLDELIRVRDHGITTDYVRGMRQLGYEAPADELVRARDHGVTVEFVRGMTSLGHSGLPLDSLVRLRDHGVTPEYGNDLKGLGYDRLSVDDLVTLRDHGLTAERIRAANARAGTRLPVDMLKSLAAGGMK